MIWRRGRSRIHQTGRSDHVPFAGSLSKVGDEEQFSPRAQWGRAPPCAANSAELLIKHLDFLEGLEICFVTLIKNI